MFRWNSKKIVSLQVPLLASSTKWIPLPLEYLSKNNSMEKERVPRILHDSQEPADPMFYFQVILQALGPTHLIWKLDDIDDPLRRKAVKSFAYAPLILLEFSPLLKIVFDAGSVAPPSRKIVFSVVRTESSMYSWYSVFFFLMIWIIARNLSSGIIFFFHLTFCSSIIYF